MEFKSPVILSLLVLLLPLLWLYFRRRPTAFLFSSVQLVLGLRSSWRMRLRHLPFFLRLVVLALFIVALAGPRKTLETNKSFSEGIDIVLLLDTSTSMAAEDFTISGKRMSRLAVIKSVVAEFIDKRRSDRVGLIAFAAKPYAVCPLTTDRGWLEKNLERIDFGLMEDGTAIGSAIASGTNRLRNVSAQSKVLILLTDGINNRGNVDPLIAAQAAQAMGVKVYTIGAGTMGNAPYPVVDIFGRRGYQEVPVEIDEATLTQVADMTGGKYFRATDTASLREIYDQIDKLEKSKVETTGYREYDELFGAVLLMALALLLAEVVLARTVFLRIP